MVEIKAEKCLTKNDEAQLVPRELVDAVKPAGAAGTLLSIGIVARALDAELCWEITGS